MLCCIPKSQESWIFFFDIRVDRKWFPFYDTGNRGKRTIISNISVGINWAFLFSRPLGLSSGSAHFVSEDAELCITNLR
jgi:hypothetical protein